MNFLVGKLEAGTELLICLGVHHFSYISMVQKWDLCKGDLFVNEIAMSHVWEGNPQLFLKILQGFVLVRQIYIYIYTSPEE